MNDELEPLTPSSTDDRNELEYISSPSWILHGSSGMTLILLLRLLLYNRNHRSLCLKHVLTVSCPFYWQLKHLCKCNIFWKQII
jgi:hypothetical protein